MSLTFKDPFSCPLAPEPSDPPGPFGLYLGCLSLSCSPPRSSELDLFSWFWAAFLWTSFFLDLISLCLCKNAFVFVLSSSAIGVLSDSLLHSLLRDVLRDISGLISGESFLPLEYELVTSSMLLSMKQILDLSSLTFSMCFASSSESMTSTYLSTWSLAYSTSGLPGFNSWRMMISDSLIVEKQSSCSPICSLFLVSWCPA